MRSRSSFVKSSLVKRYSQGLGEKILRSRIARNVRNVRNSGVTTVTKAGYILNCRICGGLYLSLLVHHQMS